MLVDDTEIIIDLLKGFLAETGQVDIVGVATDGWEAISMSEKLNPELIIMDINMPVFNGLRSAETIKSKKDAPKIILLTLHSSPEYRKAAERMGVDGFCDKLRMEEDLIGIIGRLFPERSL